MTPLPAFVVLGVALTVLSVVDLRHRRLPRRVIHVAAAGSLLWFVVVAVAEQDGAPLVRAVSCAAVAYGAGALLHSVAPSGLGFGDVRLGGLLGLDLGWIGVESAVSGLLVGLLLASATGIALVAVRARTRHDGLPLGPFLALGALAVLVAEGLGGDG